MIHMKAILVIMFILFGCVYIGATGSSIKQEKTLITGHFEGTEPFWSMEIENNRIILHCVNDTLTSTFQLSAKQAHSETYAFKGQGVFGIIRKSGGGGCELDITEEEDATHEIYFSYQNVTYMGCGKMMIR